MVKRIANVFVVVTLVALCAVRSIAQPRAAAPWFGTWKIDLEKSTSTLGATLIVVDTIKVEPTAGGTRMKITVDGSDPQGQPIHTETIGGFDGKDNPIKGARTPKATMAYQLLDLLTVVITGKVDGEPTIISRVAFSGDGQTFTATYVGNAIEGQSISNFIVGRKTLTALTR